MLRHSSPISFVSCFKNKYIATAGYDNRIILWGADTKTALTVGVHDHLVNQCEFTSCGNYLVSSSSDGTARLWRLPEMKLLTVFSDHEDDVECISVHPKLNLFATASCDCKVRVFDFTGKLQKTFIGHTADVMSVQWSEDGLALISSSNDGTIRRWDLETGQHVEILNNTGIQTDTIALAENIIFAGDDEGYIHVINNNKINSIKGHQAGIKRICYSELTKQIISVSYDRRACIWSITEDSKLVLSCEFYLPAIVWARCCAFQGDGKIIFSTFGDSFAIYDYKKGQWDIDHVRKTHGINSVISVKSDIWTVGDSGIVKKNNIAIHDLNSLCNFLIPYGETILVGGQSGQLFNAKTGDVIYQNNSPLNCVSADLNKVIVGTYTGEAIFFKKLADEKLEFEKAIKLHENAIKSLVISNEILFSVCANGAAAWHNVTTGAEIKIIQNAHTKIANSCVALNGNQFASVSRDRKLRIWHDFKLLSEISTPHTHSIKCLAVDNESRYLATGSYNGLICIYDRNRKSWSTQRCTHAGISSICFDSDKNQFLVSSYDGLVYPIIKG